MTAIAAAIGIMLGTPPAGATKIKCWTNDDGVRECGNVVPPKYSQQGHEDLNKTGVTVATHKRAKTKSEIEAERRRAEAQAARKAEEDRLARIQAAKDRVLLDTFTTEDDLLLAHQGRLAAIDTQIRHAGQIMTDQEATLAKLQREAAKKERAGQAIPDSLRKRIARVETQIANNRSFVAQRHEEKKALDVQFRKDLARYRLLKSAHK